MIHSIPEAGPPPAFPIRTVSLGLAAMILLLLTSTFLTWRVGDQIRGAISSQAEVLTAAGKVEHYGDVLEMSIKAVVSGGDAEAAARYRQVQPQLRSILTDLRTQVRGEHDARAAARVDRSDIELIGMEYHALDLVANGNFNRARKIIYSRRYDYLVDVYVGGIRGIEARASRYVDETRRELDFNIRLIVGMSAASLILVVLGWFALIVPTRRWGTALERARGAAEYAAQQLKARQVELKQLNRQLFAQARTDALTGAHTRLKFNEDIAEMSPRLERGKENICAMMCDVDHFKEYNDGYGHLAGDDVLRQVATALAGERRAGDQLYRMGGEEFLLILHGCSAADGAVRGEDFRAAVERLGIRHSGSELGKVTISIGLACFDAERDRNVQSWLRAADEAMYEAKARGRNGVVASSEMAA